LLYTEQGLKKLRKNPEQVAKTAKSAQQGLKPSELAGEFFGPAKAVPLLQSAPPIEFFRGL
jgi:hypothetical protein